MLNKTKTLLVAGVFAAALAGCSSTPTWDGMSQTDISGWKALGLDAAAAKEYTKEGFTLESATLWVQAGYSAERAEEWASENFSAREAEAWRKGGFDLAEAKKNRAKGLSPVE